MTRTIARFVTALAALVAAVAPLTAAAQQIALTFDDLPSHSALPKGETRVGVAARVIAALNEADAPPSYGFINGGSVVADPESGRVLALWRAAGHPLGNHTWTHMRLDDEDRGPFKAEIEMNEPLLAAVMGEADWRWFRYPYLYEGATAEARSDVRRFLSGRGYRVASVTLSFDDYAWNEPYARCADKGDAEAIERLEASFLASARTSLIQARARSKAALGRDIPYVLLMHIGAFDARMLPKLLDQYRRDGATFVTLEQAQADPFYAGDTQVPLGTDQLGLPSFAGEPQGSVIPADLDRLCRTG
ncbi:polysaccharide deacetylase family protein [Brevundimonas sp.]|uniref:polysaccharide deacetylase family protein n=1 Tax=Brevundimonas sp. TaxID=1871086 RepID=UPI001A18BD18|nr:polysaccharide deacetylase family protein [Brevundimonas sp.]MBJ7483227.1 polysaccharide deacetylase family protein [Brevundimonas sp.]